MEFKFTPRLTGGILFSLLLRERKQRFTSKDNIAGKADGLSDYKILQALLLVANPNTKLPIGNTARTNTSQFKTCSINNSTWFPLLSDDFINTFKYEIETNFYKTLNRVDKLLTYYIDNNQLKINRLGQSLLELIKADDTISEDTILYIKDINEGIKKRDINPLERYELKSLILGVWYYIITNKIHNTDGKETFNHLLCNNSTEHSIYNFKIDLSQGSFKNTHVYIENNIDESIYNNKNSNDFNYDFSYYLSKIKDKYGKIKTFIYGNNPVDFYSLYVCNDLFPILKRRIMNKLCPNYTAATEHKIYNTTTSNLYNRYGNFILITAFGGMGKTMMLKYLLLDSISNYETNKLLPIFVSLKDFNNTYNNLFDFIKDSVINLGLDEYELKYVLENGKAILLLDGIDEIKSELIPNFEKQLENITDKYSSCVFIMSSRPYKDLSVYSRFKEFELLPLKHQQSIQLIKKLNFRDDDPSIVEGFINILNNKLIHTHKEFTSNPLLLLIMLVTYEYYKEIPSKTYKFYQEAYEALAWKHDSTKPAYKREWYTKLNSDDFSEYLSEFCFRTYYREKFEFTYEEGYSFFKDLKINIDNKVKYSDFIKELTNTICLLYYESGKYHFTHRSFQEYFCAKYLAKQNDQKLQMITSLFEHKNIRIVDQTFSMLYDMIPERVNQFILFPYLESLMNKCEKELGYLTFLKILYPHIYYDKGEICDDGLVYYQSASYIYEFIRKINHCCEPMNFNYIGNHNIDKEEFISEYFFYSEPDIYGNRNIIETNDLIDKNINIDNLDVIGWSYDIDINIVIEDANKYKDYIILLSSLECPLYHEYLNVVEFLKQYKRKFNKESKDLYEFL